MNIRGGSMPINDDFFAIEDEPFSTIRVFLNRIGKKPLDRNKVETFCAEQADESLSLHIGKYNAEHSTQMDMCQYGVNISAAICFVVALALVVILSGWEKLSAGVAALLCLVAFIWSRKAVNDDAHNIPKPIQWSTVPLAEFRMFFPDEHTDYLTRLQIDLASYPNIEIWIHYHPHLRVYFVVLRAEPDLSDYIHVWERPLDSDSEIVEEVLVSQ